MQRHTGRYLPGLEPGYIRIEMVEAADGGWLVKVAKAQTAGLVTAADVETYGPLTIDEVHDVLGAVLDL